MSRLNRKGWLMKRGQNRKNWKKRWHEIDPEKKCLRYFDSENAPIAKALGEVSLIGSFVLGSEKCKELIGIEVDKFGEGACFAIKGPDRVFFVSDGDPQSRNEWQRLLGIICRKAGGGVAANTNSTISSGADGPDDAPNLVKPQRAKSWSPGKPYSHSELFHEYRGKKTKDYSRDSLRLQTRVGKLLIATPQTHSSRDEFEQSVVPWDLTATKCPFCTTEFSLIVGPRRSNCRLCGTSVCKNDSCSLNCELAQVALFLGIEPRGTSQIARCCADCQGAVQSAKSKLPRKGKPSMMCALYQDVIQKNKADVEATLKVYREIADLGKSSAASPARVKELRDKIYQGFGSIQAASQRIAALPESAHGPGQVIAQNIRAACIAWQTPRSVALQSNI